MKKTPYFLLILILFMLLLLMMFSCDKKQEDLAGVKHFYFEFVDQIDNQYSQSLIDRISDQLPKYDYLISEKSGAAGWPFYESVERGSKVLKSDMVPPHLNVNRLSSIEFLLGEPMQDHHEHVMKLFVVFHSLENGELILTKQSFEQNGEDWDVFSMEIESKFQTDDKSTAVVADKIAKTLTRYTFK